MKQRSIVRLYLRLTSLGYSSNNPLHHAHSPGRRTVKKLATVYRSAERILSETDNDIPSVSVGILTYNQVDYIKECLDSVFAQSGNFSMKVIIYDDCSNDGTSETICNYIQTLPEEKQPTVRYYRNDTNVGMVENFKN